MNLDIHSAFVMAGIITILGGLFSIWKGLALIRKSRKLVYFRLRHKQVYSGWRVLFLGLALFGFAFLLGRFGEPITYKVFPPSPSYTLTSTISLTPTISQRPTISLTPTISLSPEISYTPTNTSTLFLPKDIELQFKSIITPNPAAIFSPLIFSLAIDNFQAIYPQTVFQNPIQRVFVTYSYDGMVVGAQWTAIWYQNGNLLTYETGAWDTHAGTGGNGQLVLDLPAEKWVPGIYQLVFFVGSEWKVMGEFRIMGNPPTATFTPFPSLTRTLTLTPSVTHTPVPTWTPRPTDTRWPSPTSTR